MIFIPDLRGLIYNQILIQCHVQGASYFGVPIQGADDLQLYPSTKRGDIAYNIS